MEQTEEAIRAIASGGTRPLRAVQWSLVRKVSVALVSILFCTLVVAAFFAYYKFESVYSSLVQSRYSFVAFTIKKKVEDSLNLGLALRQLRQVQEVIDREKVRDPQIVTLEVYDSRGEVLFDTDRGAIGGKVAERLVEAVRGGGNQPFGEVDDDMLIVGLPLVNNLGKVEGGITLRYPRAYIDREVGSLLAELSKSTALVLAGFSMVAVLGLLLLFGRVTRKLDAMERTLNVVMAEGGQAVPEPGGDLFEQRFAEFVTKAREAVDHIEDARLEVERLDRLA